MPRKSTHCKRWASLKIYKKIVKRVKLHAKKFSKDNMTFEKKNQMPELDRALELALMHSAGNAEAFAFHLTAPLAGWMSQGFLRKETATAAIRLLHQLHLAIKV